MPHIMSLGAYVLPDCSSSKSAWLLDTASKLELFSVSDLKDENWNMQTLF